MIPLELSYSELLTIQRALDWWISPRVGNSAQVAEARKVNEMVSRAIQRGELQRSSTEAPKREPYYGDPDTGCYTLPDGRCVSEHCKLHGDRGAKHAPILCDKRVMMLAKESSDRFKRGEKGPREVVYDTVRCYFPMHHQGPCSWVLAIIAQHIEDTDSRYRPAVGPRDDRAVGQPVMRYDAPTDMPPPHFDHPTQALRYATTEDVKAPHTSRDDDRTGTGI